MSWLFDRLTDLAVADHLTIVIDIPPGFTDDPAERDEFEQMLRRARLLYGTSVWSGPRPPALATAGESAGARFVASGTPAASALFATLDDHDLGVSVGGVASGAGVQVAAITNVTSLLDSLVTLRSYAQRAVA